MTRTCPGTSVPASISFVSTIAWTTRRGSLPGGDGPREVTDPLWWRHGSRVALVRELIREDPAWGVPLCPHRPFLAAELVQALRHDGAVTLADAMLRRLVHEQGPCRDPACLRTAHALFLRERRLAVDDDVEMATAALHAETGEWSTESASHVTDPRGM